MIPHQKKFNASLTEFFSKIFSALKIISKKLFRKNFQKYFPGSATINPGTGIPRLTPRTPHGITTLPEPLFFTIKSTPQSGPHTPPNSPFFRNGAQ